MFQFRLGSINIKHRILYLKKIRMGYCFRSIKLIISNNINRSIFVMPHVSVLFGKFIKSILSFFEIHIFSTKYTFISQ